jgi:hypothetical protein
MDVDHPRLRQRIGNLVHDELEHAAQAASHGNEDTEGRARLLERFSRSVLDVFDAPYSRVGWPILAGAGSSPRSTLCSSRFASSFSASTKPSSRFSSFTFAS